MRPPATSHGQGPVNRLALNGYVVAGAIGVVAFWGATTPEAETGRAPRPDRSAAAAVWIIPGVIYADTTLLAQATGLGGPEAGPFQFRWVRNGEPMGGCGPRGVRRGASARATAFRFKCWLPGGRLAGQLIASGEVVVGNRPPVVTRVTVGPSPATVRDVLRVTVSGQDPDGDALTFRAQWLRNGEPIPAAHGLALRADALARGDRISVRLVASDGRGESEPVESPAVLVVGEGPRIVSMPPAALGRGMFAYEVRAQQSDGDVVTYALAPGGPPGTRIEPRTGLLTSPIADEHRGTHRFRIVATDAAGAVAVQELSLLVAYQGMPDGPAPRPSTRPSDR